MSVEELGAQIRLVRGWPLHWEIVQRTLAQLEDGHYDAAVFAAFKVVEERLRTITSLPGATSQTLIDAAFHKHNGVLIDPLALPVALEGQYLFFKGAFLLYRNPHAHTFVDLSRAEAFDLILMANHILLKIDDAEQSRHARSRSGQTSPSIEYRMDSYGDMAPFALDADNDGEIEILVPQFHSGAPFKMYDIDGGRGKRIEVVGIADQQFYEVIEDIVLSDVDNDGVNEVICVLGWTANTGFVVYKFRNGQFEPLNDGGSPVPTDPPVFVDAHIVDFDGDGLLEIVSVPWDAVPHDLLPPDHDPNWTWGRVRYVYKWNRSADAFELHLRELVGLGGR